ncbi:response regulator [Klebsiella pneumoniae]|nr:response regulator [Klebsiella pneumoniae]
MKTKTVLIIESDSFLSKQLSMLFHENGFHSKQVQLVDDAIDFIANNSVDIVVLDLLFPSIEGVEHYEKLSCYFPNPIIITSTGKDEESRLLGLELGAEDYICKPYNPNEVVARVKTILSRYNTKDNLKYIPHTLVIKRDNFQAIFNGRVLDLTISEFKLLKKISSKPGYIFTRESLLVAIYDAHRRGTVRAIDSHIKNLRRKLSLVCGGEGVIDSVYGVGYVWKGIRCNLE